MSKRLPVVTVLLVGVSLAFAALIAKELTSAPRSAAPRPQPAASVGAPAAAAPAAPAPAAPPNYSVVASRNLFSPTRTEAPVVPVAATPPPPPPPVLPKPNLFGVVLHDKDNAPVAYLEDPVTKRVARYRVGDSVAGGTVKAIASDNVTLLRPEGQVTVRLHDPTRPKAAAAPGAPTPGSPAITPQPGGTPGAAVNPRRPMPPGVLGRVPPQQTDGPPPAQ